MELTKYIKVLLHRAWVVAIVTIVMAVGVFVVDNFLTVPRYISFAQLRVAAATTGVVDYSSFIYYDRLINTYVKMATSLPVLDQLRAALNRYDLAASDVRVDSLSDTELIQITVDSTDPSLAQSAANKLADIMISQSQELLVGGPNSAKEILSQQLKQAEDDLNQERLNYEALLRKIPAPDKAVLDAASQNVDFKQQTYNTLLDRYETMRINELTRTNVITVVNPAQFPPEPYKPRTLRDILLGILGGGVLGVGIVFLWENFAPLIYSKRDIRGLTDLPILAEVPNMRPSLYKRIIKPKENGHYKPQFEEALWGLRMQLQIHDGRTPNRRIAITSSVPSEGKSTIVANLAKVIASANTTVLIIDGDLRIPSQSRYWKLNGEDGLTDVLLGKTTSEEAIQDTEISGVRVLASGHHVDNPSELLSSPQMEKLLVDLTNQYDYLLIDSPGILSVSDTAIIIKLVDTVYLVVSEYSTKTKDFEEGLSKMERLNVEPVGLILNRTSSNRSYYSYRRKSSSN